MNEFVGAVDILVGVLILWANLCNRAMLQFPPSHKIGLWLVGVGMIYHGCRNIVPEQFLYGSLMLELSHVGLWIIVCSVVFGNWKKRKTA